jgi:branched-chain amino acid transport system permease protein
VTSLAAQNYAITILVYLAVNAIACWALNLQFGTGGVMNFAFILFQAVGAYTTAVLTLPSINPPGETYILGMNLGWPLPLLGAAIAGGLLALAIGSFALRPRRRDFQATVMLVVSIIASTLVVTEQGWFNGNAGLYGIPRPFQDRLNLGIIAYGWFFVGLSAVLAAVTYLVVFLLTSAPWGRRLRAMRENSEAMESLGTNVRRESLKVYVVGGMIAAVSGGILVEFIGAWSPSAWGTGETFIYFVAIIVGGLGNSFGAFFGAFLVLGVFLEVPAFLPSLSNSQATESGQAAAIGVLILIFLWWRPQGIFPERRRRLLRTAVLATAPSALVAGGTLGPVHPPVAGGGRSSRSLAADSPDTPARSGPPAPALVVRDLAREFGGVRAVDGISFDLTRGELTGLIGPNGAGKSTALKLLAGAVQPTHGQILLGGDTDIAGWPAHKIAQVGVIRTFQHTSEFARLTVLENLLVAAPNQPGDSMGGALLGRRHWRHRQKELLAEAVTLLEQFGLKDAADSYAGQLSGGQRRLVEIMRAMMAKPDILLLDEPMAGVNPTLRLTVEAHLKRLRDGGLTMLMVEHELGAVERVCDEVIVMAQGRILTRGTMGEIRRNEDVVSAYLVG